MYFIERLIRVAGMKRNGNHGIVNWLLAQHSGNAVFCNAVNGNETVRTFRSDPIEAFAHNRDLNKVELTSACDKALLVLTFEDHPVGGVIEPQATEYYESWIGHHVRQEVNMTILRDPFNYFASRIQGELNGTYPLECWGDCFSRGDDLKLWAKWKSYAKRFIEFAERSPPRFIAVSYNHWTMSLGYREWLCRQLELELQNDEERKVVTGWGAGSSFDKGVWQDPATYMNRWRAYAEHPSLFLAANDEELVLLARTIFGSVLDIDGILATVRKAHLG